MPGKRFSSFSDIHVLAGGRQLVLFGTGNIAEKTIRRLDQGPFCIVDNNQQIWGAEQYGLRINSPEMLKNEVGKYFIVVCTTSYAEVYRQLEEYGYRPGQDMIISPILNDLKVIDELESHRADLLVASGLAPGDGDGGGGLYRLTSDGQALACSKLYSGKCHSILEQGGDYLVVDCNMGVVRFDKQLEVKAKYALPQEVRAHGIGYSDKLEQYYLACSHADRIVKLDTQFRQIGEIPISPKFAYDGASAHHLNDLLIAGDSLYVSMFSRTGNWKKEVFDGVVLEVDLVTEQIVGEVARDLWMPHSICITDGSLTVLDSLRGRLLKDNWRTLGTFPGFSRGLGYDGKFYFIGQSKNRNFSKAIGVTDNISIDTSVIMFDPESKVSRTLHLPASIPGIHAVHCVRE